MQAANIHTLEGFFFEPTVLADVSRDALIFNEETFGPVAPLVRFETEGLLVGIGPLDDHFAREHISYVYTLLGVDVPKVVQPLEQMKRKVSTKKTAGAAR